MLQAFLFIMCIVLAENSVLKTNDTLEKAYVYLNSSSTTEKSSNDTLGNINNFNPKATKFFKNISLPIVDNKTELSIKLNHEDTLTESNHEKEQAHILLKIHATITRSKDAVWATIVLTFMCVLLVLAVAQSQMWKDYHGSDSQGVPLPNFNERVLFRDVMRHRMQSFKDMFKKKKKSAVSELESLIVASEEE